MFKEKVTTPIYKLILDIETTGLPVCKGFGNYQHPSNLQAYNTARLIEFGCIVFDENFNIIHKFGTLRKPEQFQVEPIIIQSGDNKGKLLNDITHKKCKRSGILMLELLNKIIQIIKTFKIMELYAYNIRFDFNCLLSEAYRINHMEFINIFNALNKKCIMEYGKAYVSGEKKGRKYNAEFVYNTLHNTQIIEEHRALDDCILELKILQNLPNQYIDNNPISMNYK